MPYLLDSNAFIEAKNDYYRFSFCPGYWSWILTQNTNGNVFSIDKVKHEIMRGDDELVTWIKKDAKDVFIKAPKNIDVSLAIVAEWTNNQYFKPAAISTFFSSADYFLIAYAHALDYIVVTREMPDLNSKKRVKIPDVCVGINVNYTSPFQMLEDEKAVLTYSGL